MSAFEVKNGRKQSSASMPVLSSSRKRPTAVCASRQA